MPATTAWKSKGRGLWFEHPEPLVLKAEVRDITERIAANGRALDGVEIESKGLSSSVHFRRAAPRLRSISHWWSERSFADDDPDIEITSGKNGS